MVSAAQNRWERDPMKSMVILGSTGSIGTQALDVARLRNFTVKALTSNSNIDLLEKQIREF